MSLLEPPPVQHEVKRQKSGQETYFLTCDACGWMGIDIHEPYTEAVAQRHEILNNGTPAGW